jgi:hypothetical protein
LLYHIKGTHKLEPVTDPSGPNPIVDIITKNNSISNSDAMLVGIATTPSILSAKTQQWPDTQLHALFECNNCCESGNQTHVA